MEIAFPLIVAVALAGGLMGGLCGLLDVICADRVNVVAARTPRHVRIRFIIILPLTELSAEPDSSQVSGPPRFAGRIPSRVLSLSKPCTATFNATHAAYANRWFKDGPTNTLSYSVEWQALPPNKWLASQPKESQSQNRILSGIRDYKLEEHNYL
jgi:hypothetical protein